MNSSLSLMSAMAQRKSLLGRCELALRQNLGLTRGERVLIVTDSSRRGIGDLFQETAQALTENVELVEIAELSVNGEEPPGLVTAKMKEADVILLPLSKSLSWTEARVAATQTGARIASMPGITEEIILRTFAADYKSIRDRVNILCNLMDETDRIHVQTELGTDLSMEVRGRKGRGRRGGIYSEKGAWGNLPCGEAFIAPVEGTSKGVYVVDVVHGGVGRLSQPLVIRVQEGRAVDLQGGEAALLLTKVLSSSGDPRAFNIAELGIGCHDRAAVESITLEAEKAQGTCHIALGSNCHFGGHVDVNIHLDGVIHAPTLYFDGRKILDRGVLIVEN